MIRLSSFWTIRSKKERKTLPDYSWAYFEYLVGQYRSASAATVSAEKASAVPASAAPASAAPPPGNVRATVDKIETLINRVQAEAPRAPRSGELAELEALILDLLPDEVLRRRAWAIRERYREVAGQADYAAYMASGPPSAALPPDADPGSDRELLRGDLKSLVHELHARYSIRAQREALRSHVLIWVTISTVIVLVLASIGLVIMTRLSERRTSHAAVSLAVVHPSASWRESWSPDSVLSWAAIPMGTSADAARIVTAVPRDTSTEPRPSSSEGTGRTIGTSETTGRVDRTSVSEAPAIGGTLMIMMVMGGLGALVSVYRRAQQQTAEGESFVMLIEMKEGRNSVVMSPIFGIVFAILLYLIFAGELIQGSLFPTIIPPTKKQGEGLDVMQFMLVSRPQEAVDMAKVLVWSFIAGFAEQLVPDVLNRIVSQSQSAAGKPVMK